MSADAHLALRARALAVVVCTTGTMALAATAAGYTRASGSFVTDGFMPGMEVTPVGFTQTTPGIITQVSALSMAIAGGRSVQTSGSGRSLSVNTPTVRVFGNLEPSEAGVVLPNLPTGRPYYEEAFAPSTQQLLTTSTRGVIEHTGLFLVTWAGLANHDDIGIRRCVDAVLADFPPQYAWTLPDGSVLRVRGDIAPWAREITRRDGGWAASIITIPWQITARLS